MTSAPSLARVCPSALFSGCPSSRKASTNATTPDKGCTDTRHTQRYEKHKHPRRESKEMGGARERGREGERDGKREGEREGARERGRSLSLQ